MVPVAQLAEHLIVDQGFYHGAYGVAATQMTVDHLSRVRIPLGTPADLGDFERNLSFF